MSDYPGDAIDFKFGTEFNYALWTQGTEVDLVNVPWNNDYRDAVRFNNRAALDAYIDNKSGTGIQINNVSYLKPNEPIRVQIPHTVAQKFNYVRAKNNLQPVPGDQQKSYYYFILDVKYIAAGTTELTLQLDIFQTYMYDVEFGQCYVTRGHIGIANENAYDNYGRDYLTVPEGLDLGAEYQNITTKNKWLLTIGLVTPPGQAARYPGHDVLVISTVDLETDPGTVANPKLETAPGTLFQGTTQGAGAYIFNSSQFINFLGLYADKPWVTQGITSISVIPKFTKYYPDFTYSSSGSMGKLANSFFPRTFTHDMWPAWRSSEIFDDYLTSRYAHLKKFFTFPYMAIEMTTFHGTPVILRPEAWNTAHARVFERASLMPPSQRMEFAPRYYNTLSNTDDDLPDLYPGMAEYNEDFEYLDGVKGDDAGDFVDIVTQIANFPTMSVVNSGQLGYLASNVHGIAFSQRSADWSQSRAQGVAQAQYDISSQQMHNAMSQSGIGVNAMNEQLAINQRNLAAQGIMGGISKVTGNPLQIPSAAADMFNLAFEYSTNEQLNAVANQQAAQSVIANNETQGFTRDTNKDLANWAAKGDYENQIAGINAKVQDAALIQPTTSGQMGGEYMNLTNGGWQISLRWKMIDKAAMRIIGDYWLRYGYAIRAFIKPPTSLKVMSKFTYWKMTETYLINTGIPEGHKQGIRGIFEKGVTIWNSPDDIGNIDIADNVPLEGISY